MQSKSNSMVIKGIVAIGNIVLNGGSVAYW